MVRNDKLLVEMAADTKAVTSRAGTERVVEGKEPRLDFVDCETRLRTGEIGREHGPLAAVRIVGIGKTICQRQRGFEGVGEAGRQFVRVTLDDKPVDDKLDVVLALLVEFGCGVEVIDLAVDPDPAESLAVVIGKFLAIFALATANHRGKKIEPRAVIHAKQDVDHLADGLAADGKAGGRRVGDTDSRPQKTHVVINLGDGADGGARVAGRRFLLDRNCRRQPFDQIDVGLLHHFQKLARIGRKRFDIAALALGIDRVEGKRGFAGTRQPGKDDQPVARKIYADIGKIVLARTAYGDHTGLGPHHGVVTGGGMNIGSRRQCAVKQLTGGWRSLFRFIRHRATIPGALPRDQPKAGCRAAAKTTSLRLSSGHPAG